VPPDTAERRPGRGGAQYGGEARTRVTGSTGNTRACARCGRPLPARRRRFCSDPCRTRGQKAERVIEDADYAAGVKRLVRASARRAGADLVMFAMFADAVDYARARLADAADQLITRGYSYGDIARELGITRQAAWKRFGRKPEVDAGTPAADGMA
jgi:hypothetical protein